MASSSIPSIAKVNRRLGLPGGLRKNGGMNVCRVIVPAERVHPTGPVGVAPESVNPMYRVFRSGGRDVVANGFTTGVDRVSGGFDHATSGVGGTAPAPWIVQARFLKSWSKMNIRVARPCSAFGCSSGGGALWLFE